MLKTVAVTVAVLIAGVLIYAATRPDSFRIERSTTIKAPPERIFALINDFRQWEAWSPWEKLDPALKRAYSGAPSGKGAVYEWTGNKNVGAGRMEIVESSPPAKIVLSLDFSAPFEAHNQVQFSLDSRGESTTLTQSMYGPSPFVSKLLGLFFNMDKMVGEKYDEGLASIKAIAEKQLGSSSGASLRPYLWKGTDHEIHAPRSSR
jgi:uncharacterized protein YndB with AHSA1/START domain